MEYHSKNNWSSSSCIFSQNLPKFFDYLEDQNSTKFQDNELLKGFREIGLKLNRMKITIVNLAVLLKQITKCCTKGLVLSVYSWKNRFWVIVVSYPNYHHQYQVVQNFLCWYNYHIYRLLDHHPYPLDKCLV